MAFRIKVLFILGIIFLFPNIAKAAVLYFDPEQGTYYPGDEFLVNIRLEIGENCINAIEAGVEFNRSAVRLVDFGTGSSFLNLWITKPSTEDIAAINESGRLDFAGGVPGGYCGRIPGDIGPSNIVGTLVFKAPSFAVSEADETVAHFRFSDDTRVLANDGLGTVDELFKKEAELTIARTRSDLPKQEWSDQLKKDTIPPEPFIIELRQDPSMFNGRYYAFFSAVDKQSGLDRYEILEIIPGEEIGIAPKAGIIDRLLGRVRPAPRWQAAIPPYVLNDQSLASVIRVKAVDKAGNERIVEYVPSVVRPVVKEIPFWYKTLVLMVLVLAAAFIISLFIKKSRKKHEN